jgi:hypothetical protein
MNDSIIYTIQILQQGGWFPFTMDSLVLSYLNEQDAREAMKKLRNNPEYKEVHFKIDEFVIYRH